MSSISQIALDLAQLAQNIVRLQEQAATLPPRTQIQMVEGANQEAAQQTYINRLSDYAQMVGRKADVVRLYVEHNAEALQKAADALQNTDGDTSLAARQASAFIEAAAEASPAPTSTTSSTSSTRPDSNSRAW